LITLLQYLIKLHENSRRLNRKTDHYINDPNEKNIHDIRTSIRRFNAAVSTLPRKYREEPLLLEYSKIANKLFKVNSEIRDSDIILTKLEKFSLSPQRNIVTDTLKQTRQAKLENAKTMAQNLKNFNSNIINGIGVTENELQKRYSKILSKLISRIDDVFPIVLINPLKLEELHELRKDCKKIRYMLELVEKDDKNAASLRRILEKVQDILGSIHDSDATIIYLRSFAPNQEIQEVINKETKQRELGYEKFLLYSKRSLHLNPDSLLMRLKNTNKS
jgi:CHAD domain-containing protein